MDNRKKALLRDIIRRLHAGLGVKEAAARIEEEVGTITSAEVTEIEQSLIDEGMSPEEIRRFCNVHALLFESSLEPSVATPESPSHPLGMLKEENREIAAIVAALRASATAEAARTALGRLRGVDRHYALKENAIFPLLEKHGFPGPSQVMWAKHNDVRQMLRRAEAALAGAADADLAALRAQALEPLAAEVEGMIFKEEKILFPAALERLAAGEWVQVMESFQEIGPAYARQPQTASALAELAVLKAEAAEANAGTVSMPSGSLSIDELVGLLNVLPVDISFVDAAGKVRYFNQTRDRIFPRAVSVIGRSVQNCHPPQSVHRVNEILESFRSGARDRAEFWIDLHGRFVSIRYFAVRDPLGRYLGCLEVSQDLTGLRALTGERRLMEG